MRVRRLFVVAWIGATIAGALDHTIAESLFGRRFDLLLPHLKYGHVMFNKNPRQVETYRYEADGVAGDLADLMTPPAPGYPRARLAINVIFKNAYLDELCLRIQKRQPRTLTIIVDEWDLDQNRAQPVGTHRLRCDDHGLVPL